MPTTIRETFEGDGEVKREKTRSAEQQKEWVFAIKQIEERENLPKNCISYWAI